MIIDFKENLSSDNYWKEVSDELSKASQIVLYHGTSDVFLEKILKLGLKPRKMTLVNNFEGRYAWTDYQTEEKGKSLESNPDYVYLVHKNAVGRGMHAINNFGGNFIYFRIIIDNISKLVPDEDSRKDNWHDSLAWEDSCAFNGRILPSKILGFYTKREDRKSWNYNKINPEPINVVNLDKKSLSKIIDIECVDYKKSVQEIVFD